MKNTQDAINAIRKGDPLKHDTIQEIGDMLEDLDATCKERGEKLGRLRNRVEAEETRNFQLEDALKHFLAAFENNGETTSLYEWNKKLKAASEKARSALTWNGGTVGNE